MHLRLCVGIDRRNTICLVAIACRTSKAKIVKDRLTTGRPRNDVFTFEYGNRQALCGSAVCAAVGEVFGNLSSKTGRNVAAHALVAPVRCPSVSLARVLRMVS